MKRKDNTRAAIARLASLFPYGALEADTMPAVFLGHVADEIERLRAKVAPADCPRCEKDHADCMALPTGRTCGDCRNAGYCVALFGCSLTATTCDWAPSRFRLSIVTAAEEARRTP
mgnify:CR=1 FL=1